jgi:hypothetical protein
LLGAKEPKLEFVVVKVEGGGDGVDRGRSLRNTDFDVSRGGEENDGDPLWKKGTLLLDPLVDTGDDACGGDPAALPNANGEVVLGSGTDAALPNANGEVVVGGDNDDDGAVPLNTNPVLLDTGDDDAWGGGDPVALPNVNVEVSR